MTQEVTPSQAAREAAAEILRLYGALNYALLCEKNSTTCDGLAIVQAFARFEEQTRTATEREVVERIATMLDLYVTPFGRAGSAPDAIEGQMRKMAAKVRALSEQKS